MEFELRLNGQDANENSLLDFMDWLERAHIDGLLIQRKMLPPKEGYQSAGFDPITLTLLLNLPTAINETTKLLGNIMSLFEQWQSITGHNVSSEFDSKNAETKQQIQKILKEMEESARSKRNS